MSMTCLMQALVTLDFHSTPVMRRWALAPPHPSTSTVVPRGSFTAATSSSTANGKQRT